ncbi:uncharacterized protein METZ01_LOCUS420138, partial [marine metagenome]
MALAPLVSSMVIAREAFDAMFRHAIV